jgi:hypothetical protein
MQAATCPPTLTSSRGPSRFRRRPRSNFACFTKRPRWSGATRRSSSSGPTRRRRARPGSTLTANISAGRVRRARLAALFCNRRPRARGCARRVCHVLGLMPVIFSIAALFCRFLSALLPFHLRLAFAGFYCPSGSSSATQNACASGNYCSSGTSSPVACAAGSVCANATIQSDCAFGEYCPASTTTASLCPAGNYCSNASSLAACVGGVYCPAGSTNATGAGPCEEGYYCASSVDRVACTADFYCPVGSAEPIPIVASCNPGYGLFVFFSIIRHANVNLKSVFIYPLLCLYTFCIYLDRICWSPGKARCSAIRRAPRAVRDIFARRIL